jgi:recombination protein RecR
MKPLTTLEKLTDSLRCLPGVGAKSAARMSLHLLQHNRAGGLALAEALTEAMNRIGHCEQCRNYTEQPLCSLCADQRRDATVICVVETPSDVAAIESSRSFQGLYHVLMGHLSPLDGIGPDDIGLDKLEERVQRGGVAEVILATGSTVEGEATAHYIGGRMTALGVGVSRLARGVPMGGELDYVDSSTIAQALSGRRPLG